MPARSVIDNAYVESFFRTLKYAPTWPGKGFTTLGEAREWVQQFMQWYNHGHQHSKIRFVTPAQRHHGEGKAILAKRVEVYTAAKAKHPERWSGNTWNWTPIAAVILNPDKRAFSSRIDSGSCRWGWILPSPVGMFRT